MIGIYNVTLMKNDLFFKGNYILQNHLNEPFLPYNYVWMGISYLFFSNISTKKRKPIKKKGTVTETE